MAQVTLPYTLTAGTPENVNNLMSNLTALRDGVNTIDTAQIASGAVTSAKLGSGAVDTTALGAGAVTAAKLGSASGIISNIQSTTVTGTVTTSITTGGTFYDVSGLSVSITPSSSGSKVLAWFTFNGSCDTQDRVLYCRLVRGSTAIGIGDAAGSRPRATAASYQAGDDSAGNPTSRQVTGIYLDSPATTSATTYKVQASLNVSSTTLYTNRSGPADSDSTGFPRQVCTITVAEVA